MKYSIFLILLLLPLIPAFGQQPCNAVTYANGSTISYSGANCAVTLNPQTTSTTPTITNTVGSLPSGILSQFQSFLSGIISNSGLNANNNPAHLDSGKLGQISNSWMDTIKKILGVGFSLHNATATTISNTSPIPIDPMIVFIIGAIFTVILIGIILWKFFKGIMKIIGVVLVIVIILMEYKIQIP